MELDYQVRGRGGTGSKVGSQKMATKQSQVAEELVKFYEAALLDLPITAARRLVGAADEKSLTQAGWKAYDAWVRLANETRFTPTAPSPV
jgi:hypothetical protein